jgi:hypothetical protein
MEHCKSGRKTESNQVAKLEVAKALEPSEKDGDLNVRAVLVSG